MVFCYKPILLLPTSLPRNKCSMQTSCMPTDRPTNALFSPIRGKMCNTRMHIVYVWQETKIPSSTSLLEKKTKPNKQNHDKTKQNKTSNPLPPLKIRYWFCEMPAFSRRYCVPQVSATLSRCRSKSSTLCPRLGRAGIADTGVSISINRPQCPQETSQPAHRMRGDFGSPLVLRGHPEQSLPVTSPFAELCMRKEGRRCCAVTAIVH